MEVLSNTNVQEIEVKVTIRLKDGEPLDELSAVLLPHLPQEEEEQESTSPDGLPQIG